MSAIVSDFARQGLLIRSGDASLDEAWPSSLHDALDPALLPLLPSIGEQLQAGRAVVVRNAMQAQLAARVFEALDGVERWTAMEVFGHGPHYRQHVLLERESPAILARCRALFDAPASRALASELGGRDCSGPLEFGATRYVPGDFATEHADDKLARSLAFVWHLARDWEPAWGGHFVWCSTGARVVPGYNTLILFDVSPATVHAVSPVSSFARGKRLSVTGWWSDAGPARGGDPSGGLNRWGIAHLGPGPEPLALSEPLGVFAL
ncbi:2OG-Fe(II) oxygenase [Nannocystaceae bacterium ST9]